MPILKHLLTELVSKAEGPKHVFVYSLQHILQPTVSPTTWNPSQVQWMDFNSHTSHGHQNIQSSLLQHHHMNCNEDSAISYFMQMGGKEVLVILNIPLAPRSFDKCSMDFSSHHCRKWDFYCHPWRWGVDKSNGNKSMYICPSPMIALDSVAGRGDLLGIRGDDSYSSGAELRLSQEKKMGHRAPTEKLQFETTTFRWWADGH